MNIAQIENKLQLLVKSINKDTFIFDLFLAYRLDYEKSYKLTKTSGKTTLPGDFTNLLIEVLKENGANCYKWDVVCNDLRCLAKK